MSLAWSAYRIAAPLIGAAAPALRMVAPASERRLWGERMGCVPAGLPVHAWIHAASLGEATAVGPLTRELARAQPGARFHLTASTPAGRSRLGEQGHPHSLAPIDAPQAVTHFVAAVRPRRLFLIETELWPHWLLHARAGGVPVAVVSARLSERSVPGYRRFGPEFGSLVAGLDAVLCQSEGDAARWRALGAPERRTAVVGNLKDDALVEPAGEGTAERLAGRRSARSALGLDPDRPLAVFGSVRPDEVRLLARAWRRVAPELQAGWQVVAAPRHPDAGPGLRREAGSERQPLVEDGAPAAGAWRWDERLGMLPGYYAAADLAVVGGTLGPYGGHNPLEPAARAVAVIVGPHHAAQADAVAALVAAGAARVATGETALSSALGAWLGDEAARCAAGAAGLAVVRARRGAARRAVSRLEEWGLWPAA